MGNLPIMQLQFEKIFLIEAFVSLGKIYFSTYLKSLKKVLVSQLSDSNIILLYCKHLINFHNCNPSPLHFSVSSLQNTLAFFEDFRFHPFLSSRIRFHRSHQFPLFGQTHVRTRSRRFATDFYSRLSDGKAFGSSSFV